MGLSWMAWTWPTAAFIFLAWLGIMGTPLCGGLAISLAYGFAVFRWV